MKTKDFKQQIMKTFFEDEEEVEKLEVGSKEWFLAKKAQSETIKAVAELDEADANKKSNTARNLIAGGTLAGTVLMAGVELYKAWNKNHTNEKVLKHQIDLIGKADQLCFDNRG